MSQAGPRRRRSERSRPRTPSILMLVLAVCLALGLVCGSAWLLVSMPDEVAPEGVGDLLEGVVEDPGGDCLAPACLHLAELGLADRSDLDAADAALRHAVSIEPELPGPWVQLVLVDALRGGDLDRERILEAVEAFHPHEPGLEMARGASLLAEGRLVEARSHLRGVEDLRLQLDLRLALEQYEDALVDAQALLEANPADVHACEVATRSLWGRGHVAQAEALVADCLEAGAALRLAALSGAIAESGGRHDVALSRYVAAGDADAEARLRHFLGEDVPGPEWEPTALQATLMRAREENTDGAWLSLTRLDPDNPAIWRERLASADGPGLDAALSELEGVDPQRFVLRRGLEMEWSLAAPSSWDEVLEKTDDHPCVRLLAGLPVDRGPALWVSASRSERGLGAQALSVIDGDGPQERNARVAALLASGRSIEAQAEALAERDAEEPATRALLALALASREDPEPALRALELVLREHPDWHALRAERYELSNRLAVAP